MLKTNVHEIKVIDKICNEVVKHLLILSAIFYEHKRDLLQSNTSNTFVIHRVRFDHNYDLKNAVHMKKERHL